MTGAEMKDIRHEITDAVAEAAGGRISLQNMAKLCGLKDPQRNGKDTWLKWENGDGPSGPVATLLALMADGLSDDSPEVRKFMLGMILDMLEGEAFG